MSTSVGGFSEQTMTKKLEQLNATMQSVQTLSLWLMHHRKHSARIVQVWLREVKLETKSSRLLSLIYLANDVIQNSRKKWPQFQEHFYSVLEKACEHISRHADESTLKSINHVVSVWKDRSVYSGSAIARIVTALKGNMSGARLAIYSRDVMSGGGGHVGDDNHQLAGSSAVSPVTPPGRKVVIDDRYHQCVFKRKLDSKVPDVDVNALAPTTGQLLKALRGLEDPASADGDTRQLIASFPEAIANPTFLKQIATNEHAEDLHKKIKEAEPVVSDYCSRLAIEIDQRRATHKLLIAYLDAQKVKAANTEILLNRFREKREQLANDRLQVYKHYDSLPDLSQLPNVDQLNPLPSVGELFDKK